MIKNKKKKVVGRGGHMISAAIARKRAHREKYGAHTTYTPERGKAFCAVLAETCNVGQSSKSVGVTRRTAYTWKENYAEFAKEWDKAKEVGLTALEDEAVRRGGVDGVPEPVYYKGKKIATVKKHSDTLLTFLLSAHKPDVYGKNRTELTGKGGAPLVPMKFEVVFVEPKKEVKK